METVKESELRIGNLVYETINNHNEEVVKITSLSDMLIVWSPYRNTGHHNHIKPIPLTEEWLLKFEIQKENGYPYRFCKGYLKLRNGIYFYKYYNIEINLNYVHQLQNLYFALTGKELLLSLPQ